MSTFFLKACCQTQRYADFPRNLLNLKKQCFPLYSLKIDLQICLILKSHYLNRGCTVILNTFWHYFCTRNQLLISYFFYIIFDVLCTWKVPYILVSGTYLSTMIKMSRFLLSSFVPNGFSLHCVLSFHWETNDAERVEKGRHTSQKLD